MTPNTRHTAYEAMTIQHGEAALGVVPCQNLGLVSVCQLFIFTNR